MSATTGFSIAWLRLSGPGMADAEIEFSPGLTVVWGASQTGKSFIFACLDYMTGGETPPKAIKQLTGYTTARLAITIRPDRRLVLERSLKGGDFMVYEAAGDAWTLSNPVTHGGQHNPDRTDTISHLLLSSFGMQDSVIVVSKDKAKTRKISFRDFAHMSFVHEQRIIDEATPIYPTKQHTAVSEELSTFSCLISGSDWKGVVALPDMKLAKATWRGKTELYEQLVEELKTDLGDNPPPLQSVIDRIAACDATIAEVTPRIADSSSAIARSMVTRKGAWEVSHQARSRLLVIEQLRDRFALLKKHYQSDLDRLKFIEEGDFFLSQLGDPHCPFCGKPVATHSVEQLKEEEALASIQDASRTEAGKIVINMQDLEATLRSLQAEQEQLDRHATTREDEIIAAERTIREELEPRLGADKAALTDAVEQRARLLAQQFKLERLAKLVGQHAALGKEPKRSKKTEPKIDIEPNPASLRQFSDVVGEILREWRYTKIGTVEFDAKREMVVDGEPRLNQGKGIRAVLHSAFTVGLMRHCEKRGLKHSGVVLLDSPLTSYRPADEYVVGEDIQVGFFESLMKLPEHQQVIVFENKEPPAVVRTALRATHFSGSPGVGRQGFIPPPPISAPGES